jgi:8-oxo-(d)GTP phosphatase
MSDVVRAAGGLVVRCGREGIEVLLVHRPAYDDWTFPKGKLESGELEPDAAVREVAEETGLACLLGRELGETEYADSRGRPKRVRYWTMVAPAGGPRPTNEVDDVVWAAPAEAAGRLSYERDQALLRRLDEAVGAGSEPVFLVRHAKAGNREKWEGRDELRPLSPRGRRQAEALADLFADTSFAALVSSPYVRCVETLAPLAGAQGLPVQEHDALAEGAAAIAALELVCAVAVLGPAALSTHGDVQQLVVQSLAAADVPLEGSLAFQKGSTWVVEVHRGEVVSGRYIAPPA